MKVLSKSEYFWDKWNSNPVGQYLTEYEKHYIDLVFQENKNIKSVLDVGCGSGRFSIPIHNKGIKVVALEYDKIPLVKLKSKDQTIPMILGDGKKLPFKNQSFDCIICIQALDYIDIKQDFFFKECNRTLKKTGLLLFTLRNKNSYKRFITRLMTLNDRYSLPFTSLNDSLPVTSLNDLKQKLYNIGFTIEKVKGYNWVPLSRYDTSKFINSTKVVHYFASFERLFKLEALLSISPWFFVTARK